MMMPITKPKMLYAGMAPGMFCGMAPLRDTEEPGLLQHRVLSLVKGESGTYVIRKHVTVVDLVLRRCAANACLFLVWGKKLHFFVKWFSTT